LRRWHPWRVAIDRGDVFVLRRLYVVTHPESRHHVSGLVGGWFDSELTDRGLRQTELIAKRIRELVTEDTAVHLCSSDLKRAAQTAQAIARQLGVEPTFMKGLREKSYGEAEGKAQSWLDERFVPPPASGDRMNHAEGIEGSETRHDFAARIYEVVSAIFSSSCSHHVIVTHGGALTFVIAAWIDLPLEAAGYISVRSSSGSITVLGQDDFFHNRAVVSLNDTSHLTHV